MLSNQCTKTEIKERLASSLLNGYFIRVPYKQDWKAIFRVYNRKDLTTIIIFDDLTYCKVKSTKKVFVQYDIPF
jgi:hypothetical protein